MFQCVMMRRVCGTVAALALVACGGGDGASNGAEPSADTVGGVANVPTTDVADASFNVDGVDGAEVYARCMACHQANGQGLTGAFPPLAGSEWVTGNPAVGIRVVLHGMSGPVTVAGTEYNALMMAYGTGVPMTDAEIAAVMTYVRGSWGNNASPVTSAQVAAEREATKDRAGPWNAAELQSML